MRVFKGFVKANDRSIETLTKTFGVDAKVFLPIKSNRALQGFKDNDIEYGPASVTRRVLIPAIFRTQNRTLEALDPFHEDGERLLYVPSQVLYPQYTKLVILYQGSTNTFIVTEVLEKKDDVTGSVLTRKYVIVPDLTFNADNGEEALEGMASALEDELSTHTNPEEDFLDKTVLPARVDTLDTKFTIKPVKAVEDI